MKTPTLVLSDVRTRGVAALRRELGNAGMVLFLQQFDKGRGDYTKERHKILDKFDIDAIMTAIKAQRRKIAK
ncbi:MAG: hypothetical protein WCP86_06420 [bacterium]|jgi:hypothetical protein